MNYQTALDRWARGGGTQKGGKSTHGKLTGQDAELISHWRRRHDRLLAGIHAVLKARPHEVHELRTMLDKLLKLDVQPLKVNDQ